LNVGSGNEELPRWYFDIKTQSCLPFSYGGIGGGENNFIAKSSCEARCPGRRLFAIFGYRPVYLQRIDTIARTAVHYSTAARRHRSYAVSNSSVHCNSYVTW
jgi:hypothetical protein